MKFKSRQDCPFWEQKRPTDIKKKKKNSASAEFLRFFFAIISVGFKWFIWLIRSWVSYLLLSVFDCLLLWLGSIFIDCASEPLTITLSNIVIWNGLVPCCDLSCTKRNCISQKVVMIRWKTEMFKCHHEQPLRSVISHGGLWSLAVKNVYHNI